MQCVRRCGVLLSIFLILLFFLFIPQIPACHATQFAITESARYAHMGGEKSRRQTEQQAPAEAKRHVVEQTLCYLQLHRER